MTKLQMLALDHMRSLAEKALKCHAELEKWRDPPLDVPSRIRIGMDLIQALEIQKEWIDAIEEDENGNS